MKKKKQLRILSYFLQDIFHKDMQTIHYYFYFMNARKYLKYLEILIRYAQYGSMNLTKAKEVPHIQQGMFTEYI